MVGQERHHRVLQHAALRERRRHLADLRVHQGDAAVIKRGDAAQRRLVQVLVVLLAAVALVAEVLRRLVGEPRGERRRHRQHRRVVHRRVRLRRVEGYVRIGQAHEQEQRLFGRMPMDQLDGPVAHPAVEVGVLGQRVDRRTEPLQVLRPAVHGERLNRRLPVAVGFQPRLVVRVQHLRVGGAGALAFALDQLVEGGELRVRQVQLAGARGAVPVGAQVLRQGELVVADGDVVGRAAVHVRVAGGQDRGAAGHALRVLRERLREARALCRQSVDVRRSDDRIAVAADAVGAELIRQDHHEVGGPAGRASGHFDSRRRTPATSARIASSTLTPPRSSAGNSIMKEPS